MNYQQEIELVTELHDRWTTATDYQTSRRAFEQYRDVKTSMADRYGLDEIQIMCDILAQSKR